TGGPRRGSPVRAAASSLPAMRRRPGSSSQRDESMSEGNAVATGPILRRIEAREAVCGVMGLGYVGLPLGVEVARAGFRVLGFDVSETVVSNVNAGKSHIQDVPSEALAEHVSAGRLEATTDMGRLGECDVVLICVPTPLSKTRDPDVSYVVAATEAVAGTLRRGQLIVLEETACPGAKRAPRVAQLAGPGLPVGVGVFVVFRP